MSSAANNAIYAGLKFTGLALTVASDLAKSVRKDLVDAQEKESRVSVPAIGVPCHAMHLTTDVAHARYKRQALQRIRHRSRHASVHVTGLCFDAGLA